MNKNDIIEQLKNSQEEMKPDQDWVKENRNALLSEIREEKKEEQTSSTLVDKVTGLLEVLIPRKAVLAVETAVFVFAIVFVAVGGWTASVKASYSALPGDTLYNVKMITEKAQLAVTEVVGSESEKAKLHSEFATRRAQELKKAVKKKEDPKQIQETIDKMNKSISQAQEALQKAEKDKEKESGETTEDVVKQTELIVKTLSDVLVDVSNDSVSLVDDVAIAQGKITEDSLNLLEGMVRAQLQGKISLSKEEVQTLVSETVSELSQESIKTKKVAASLDKKLVKKIAAGVANHVEKQNDKQAASDIEKNNAEKSETTTKKEAEVENKTEEEKTGDSEKSNIEDSDKNESGEDEIESDKNTDSDSTSSSPEVIASEETVSSTSSSTEKAEKEADSAKKLANEGKLLEAINKVKNISIESSEEIKNILNKAKVKTREDENGQITEEIFLELNNEGETVTTTVPLEQKVGTSTTGTTEAASGTKKVNEKQVESSTEKQTGSSSQSESNEVENKEEQTGSSTEKQS